MDTCTQSRSWSDLRSNVLYRKSSVPLNPLRNWVEQVRHENDRIYEQLHNEKGLTRPDKVIQFLEGDPTRYSGFPTPNEYKEIAAQAVGQHDGYTDFLGDLQTRKKFAEKLSSQKWKLTEDDVILTWGGGGALFLCINSLCSRGDKILMPRPTFPLMTGLARAIGVEIVWYDLEDKEWQPKFDQIEEQLKTHQNIKFILVNSPSNPNGSTLSEESKHKLISICKQFNNLPIVADEIYEYMTFESKEFKFLAEYSDTVPILCCSGLTKRALVPGWRMGWLVLYGQPGVFDEVKRAIRNFTNILLMPNTICQKAAFDIYIKGQSQISRIMDEIKKRYECLKSHLEGVRGIRVNRQSGSIYSNIVLDLDHLVDIENAKVFASKLQIEQNLLLFPGPLFFGGDFIRVVICGDLDQIEEACQRLRVFLEQHSK